MGVVVLAAGASSRMGRPKLLLPWGDTTVIGHLIANWQTVGARQITVVVADDHPLYRDGVVRALTASGQVDVVAEAGDGRAALSVIRDLVPDVALVDYRLPELDGVAIAHAVRRDGLATRVLLVSAFTDSGVVYKALETGA